MQDPIAWLLIAILAGGISYGSFKLNRYVNYEIDYKYRLQESIKKSIKEDCLK